MGFPAYTGESTPDQDPPVRLHRNATQAGVWRGTEATIQATVSIKTGEAGLENPPHIQEIASEQDLSVRLHCKTVNRIRIVRRSRIRVKAAVQRPVRVQTGDVFARHPSHSSEPSTDQNFPVRLHRKAFDPLVEIRVKASVS